MFIISAEIYAFGILAYLILASGKEQYWASGWPPKNSGTKTPAEISAAAESATRTRVKGSVQTKTTPPTLPEKARLVQPHGADYGSV